MNGGIEVKAKQDQALLSPPLQCHYGIQLAHNSFASLPTITKMKSLRIISLALAADAVAGWWCSGHMLTADVALRCGTLSTKAKAAVDDLIAEIASYYPASPQFIESACWADDLKSSAAPQEAVSILLCVCFPFGVLI